MVYPPLPVLRSMNANYRERRPGIAIRYNHGPRASADNGETDMGNEVEIVDVGPRDGLQSQPRILDTDTKLALIERLVDAGVRRLEVASFVNPKRVPTMADADAVVARLPRRPGVKYIGLVLNC